MYSRGHACVYIVCLPACVCTHVCALPVCAHWRGCDSGRAPIPTVPRDVSQEPVSCPSPAYTGEQSSFQLTAAHVCRDARCTSQFLSHENEIKNAGPAPEETILQREKTPLLLSAPIPSAPP